MAHLNQKGPEENGSGTGRGLGLCNKQTDNQKLGAGMGLRRNAENGKGMGKRYRSALDKKTNHQYP